MAHIGQKRRLEPVGLLGADTGLDDLKLGVFLLGDVPRHADNQRQTVLDRNQRFRGVDDARLPLRRDILFDELHALARAQQFEVVAPEMLRILRTGKHLVIGISERFRRGDMRKLLESPVPVEITELVAGVLDEEIDRNIVEDAVKDGVHLLDLVFVFDAPRDVATEEPDDFALLEVVVDDIGHDVPRHDTPLSVLQTDGVFVCAVVPADLRQPLLPQLPRRVDRPELVHLAPRQIALQVVPPPETFVGVLHRPVYGACVNLLIDIVQRILDHLQLVLGDFGLGDVAADAEGVFAVEGHDAVFVIAGPAVERDVVMRRGTLPRRENVFEVVLHVAARFGRKHRPDIPAHQLGTFDPDMIGLLGGDQFDQRPVASQHGQHVGNRIQNLTGVPVAEAARGVGRRSEPRLKLFDPADKLLAGAVIIMAHMSRNCGGSYKGNIIPGSRRLFPDKTDYRRNQSDKCSSARERHPEFHAGAVRNRHRQHSAEPPRRRANRRCVPGGTHPDEHQRRQAPVR